ncbi:MAG: hypothetical protein A2W22_03045 [Candidatus Levybacteria bacterium RBG_16_35_11]|nr:MAG: hypothetical protein A2W22_03045 [Candidatus Levybacteria bacterium RBG_16_35_11]
MSDIVITSGLDQSIPISVDTVLDKVDTIFMQSLKEKDPYLALNEAKTVLQLANLSGWYLAKLLYLMEKNWTVYEIDDRFEDVVFSWMGLHRDTVSKYVKVWSLFAGTDVPESRKLQLLQRNIKDLIPIANAISQGYEIEDEDWEEISDAVDFNSLSEVMREIKGQEPRKNAMRIFMDNVGTLFVYHQDKEYFLGSLEVSDDNEIVKKAINRIIKNSGIIQK